MKRSLGLRFGWARRGLAGYAVHRARSCATLSKCRCATQTGIQANGPHHRQARATASPTAQ